MSEIKGEKEILELLHASPTLLLKDENFTNELYDAISKGKEDNTDLKAFKKRIKSLLIEQSKTQCENIFQAFSTGSDDPINEDTVDEIIFNVLKTSQSHTADLVRENMKAGLELGLKLFCNNQPEHFQTIGIEWLDLLAPKAEAIVKNALKDDIKNADFTAFKKDLKLQGGEYVSKVDFKRNFMKALLTKPEDEKKLEKEKVIKRWLDKQVEIVKDQSRMKNKEYLEEKEKSKIETSL